MRFFFFYKIKKVYLLYIVFYFNLLIPTSKGNNRIIVAAYLISNTTGPIFTKIVLLGVLIPIIPIKDITIYSQVRISHHID